MEGKTTKVLCSAVPDDDAVLSRRKMLEGIGWAGLFALAGSQLLAPKPAAARPVDRPVGDAATQAEAAKHDPESQAANVADVTDFSAHRRRYWRRYYWHRHYRHHHHHWRRRYWRRRYWRRRYWW